MAKDFLIHYDNLSDEQLVKLSSGGDIIATECVLSRYKNLVRSKARMYFLVGADKEDIIQEGMIGLFKAIRDFSSERQVSFRGFAELCIKRQIITAVKTATRQKHIPLNSYVSLSNPVYESESEGALEDVLESNVIADPEHLFISKENAAFLSERMNEILSDLEKSVLALYMEGKSYQEIAKELSRSHKSIDNALQRVKKKMEKFEEF
ncbi:MAG: RNA polymerase sporulation sigma factor SigH [Clostridia bacterium]|nr:RNA polymerase sporulation sigma factor SigH [Clostridia bacterium]MBR6523314.1 RNA polymerase sporulation sigma factor SigH [Clostridia bacterium]